MFSSKVSVLDLEARIDAEFYSPDALKCLNKINAFEDTSSLGEIISEGYRVVYHGTDSVNGLSDADVLPFLSPSQIDENGSINFEKTDELPLYYKNKYPKGLASPGELLIEVKGNVSKLAVVPDVFPENLLISGSLYKAKISSEYDSRFILSFLKCGHGQTLKSRLTSNTIINYIAKDDLYSIPVFKINDQAQTYIGNKVRQAELLREWAKATDKSIISFHKKLIPEQSHLDFDRKTRAVSVTQMTERMDAHFYPGVVDTYLHETSNKFQKLDKICSGLFNGQTQPEANEESCKQITVANLSPNYVKGEPRSVEVPSKVDRFTKKFDLFMCNAAHNKYYIGRDITFNHSDKKLLPSTEVMVIRCDHSKIPATYLRAYLLTRLGYIQIQSTIRGITAHSYPVDMAKLDIFVPKMTGKEAEEWFATDERLAIAGLASEYATQLTASAKYLVESLIEGQITEAELIAAQQALEEGDSTKDRGILSKLTDKGYLVDGGKPLFPDLDKLYELLEEAQQAKDAEQDGDEGAQA